MVRHHCQRCEDKDAELAYLRHELGTVIELDQARRLKKAAGIGLCEAKIVLHLRQNKRHTATRMQLVDHLAGETVDKAVDTHICKIRKVLGHDAFETIRGEGFHLTPVGVARVDALLAS